MAKASDVAVYTDLPTQLVSAIERAPTPDEMSELLETVAADAHPVAGRLKALAHVVRVLRRCPWITGTVRMELERGDNTTAVHLFAEHGGGRERALRSVVLDVVLDELREVMLAKPDLFAPLRMSDDETEDTLVFVAAS